MSKNINLSELILSPEDSQIIYKMSWLFLFTSLYGFYESDHYMLSFLHGCIFLNSINYWRKPIRGFRRNFDILTNIITLLYGSYYVYGLHNNHLYYYCVLSIKINFALSWFVYSINRYKLSVFLHCLVHLSGNIGNLLLFSDIVREIQ
jgi:hypothetical protein